MWNKLLTKGHSLLDSRLQKVSNGSCISMDSRFADDMPQEQKLVVSEAALFQLQGEPKRLDDL